MKMPKFSAEVSLYGTSGHYRTGRCPTRRATRAVNPIHLAMDEVIEVFGCAPGFLELGEGENMVCIPDPSWSGGGDPGVPSGPSGEGPHGPGGGGGTAPVPTKGGGVQEAKRKARCQQCKAKAQKCLNQAILAGKTCSDNAKTMAASRCQFNYGEVGEDTVTAWGCSIWDLVNKRCVQAESPWDKGWEFSCNPPVGTPCSGPGINNCMSSWRQSHPNGSESISGTGQLSATFEGIGAQGSQTFTETYTWNGRTGYASVCATVGSNLSHKCTARQNDCYSQHNCTAEDLQ